MELQGISHFPRQTRFFPQDHGSTEKADNSHRYKNRFIKGETGHERMYVCLGGADLQSPFPDFITYGGGFDRRDREASANFRGLFYKVPSGF